MRQTLIYSAGLAVLLACTQVHAQPVGYWTFDDTTADVTGNGNDGTIVGGVTFSADVPAVLGAGKSAAFDGVAGTYVNVTHGTGLPITAEPNFTISMWVKGDGTVDNVDDRVFSEGQASNTDPLFNLGTQNQGADGRFDFYYRNAGSPNHQYSTGSAFDGSWHHIAWVDSNQIGTLYIDGVADTTFDYTAYAKFVPETTSIGAVLRATDCCNFTGNIDDVAVYNVALSAASVQALAAGASPLQVPEPSSLLLTSLAVVGFIAGRRRTR